MERLREQNSETMNNWSKENIWNQKKKFFSYLRRVRMKLFNCSCSSRSSDGISMRCEMDDEIKLFVEFEDNEQVKMEETVEMVTSDT